MSIRPIMKALVLTLTATLAIAFCVVAGRTQTTGAKTVPVTITPGTPPTVSPETATISKSEGDQVEWKCPDCTAGFTVHFPQGTPFTSSRFSNAHPKSGSARADAAERLYHYSVTVNGHTADPGVQVNR